MQDISMFGARLRVDSSTRPPVKAKEFCSGSPCGFETNRHQANPAASAGERGRGLAAQFDAGPDYSLACGRGWSRATCET